jgi:hypothetical protein
MEKYGEIEKWRLGDTAWRHGHGDMDTKTWTREAQAIFLILFIVCSSRKRKFVICLFDNEETNRSYSFANGLNGLNGFDHLFL